MLERSVVPLSSTDDKRTLMNFCRLSCSSLSLFPQGGSVSQRKELTAGVNTNKGQLKALERKESKPALTEYDMRPVLV